MGMGEFLGFAFALTAAMVGAAVGGFELQKARTPHQLVVGTVESKDTYTVGKYHTPVYEINVSGHMFQVDEEYYNSLKSGDTVQISVDPNATTVTRK